MTGEYSAWSSALLELSLLRDEISRIRKGAADLKFSLRSEEQYEDRIAYKACGQIVRSANYLTEKVNRVALMAARKQRAASPSYTDAKITRRPWRTELDLFVRSEARHLCQLREQHFGEKWQVDHMVPLRHRLASGLDVAANLQVVPRGFNARKSNRSICETPFSWMAFY